MRKLTSSKKTLLIYGVFDRYNYGDLLMPLLFEMFLNQHNPGVLDKYEICFASLTKSNLSKVGGPPTLPISECLDSLPEDSVILVAGGAVIGASAEAQFFQRLETKAEADRFRDLKKNSPELFARAAKSWLGFGGLYPYTPEPSMFPAKVKVIFNAVGSRMNGRMPLIPDECYARLNHCDHLSVRDRIVYDHLKGRGNGAVKLSPDSAVGMRKLIDDKFLSRRVRMSRMNPLPKRYFVFQAAPHKVACDMGVLEKALRQISAEANMSIVLLPVGYAQGHDDPVVLGELAKRLNGTAVLMGDLNIWEILSVIRNSVGVVATSLHAVITAVAYGRPYFSISPKVPKLTAFLETWGLGEHSKVYDLTSPEEIASVLVSADTEALEDNAENLSSLVIENNMRICECL